MDKTKIDDTINQLDKHKRIVLNTVLSQVSDLFGSFFSVLLKGCNAELVKVSDKEDMSDGLKIRVSLASGIWKESLTELSGGQR